MSTVNTEPDAEPVAGADRRRWLGLFFLLLAGAMDLVDSTVVNIAVPSIERDFGGGYAAMQWIVAGYAIAFALTLITGARLGDIFGRKRVFLVGTAGFVLASLLCGMAPDAGTLIAARLLQGVLAGAMVPQVLSIMTVLFEPKDRGRAFALFATVATVATVGGPPLGAFLTDADLFGLGWRSVFLVNLPLGALAFAGVLLLVPESKAARGLRLDWPGMGLATLAMFLLLFPLVQGRDAGWPLWTFLSLAAAVVVLLVFVVHERRRTAEDDSPLVDLRLFASRAFTGGLAIYLVFMGGIIAYYFVFMVYLQTGLGFSVLRAGLMILPFAIGAPFGAGLAVPLTAKIGRRVLYLGSVLLALAMAGVLVTVGRAAPDLSVWQLTPALLAGGIGMGMVVTPLFDFVLSEVPPEQAGSASGVLNAVQQVGAAVGVAAIGVVFFAVAGSPAVSRDEAFGRALEFTLWLEAGVFLVVTALVTLLPRKVTYPEVAGPPG
ncbi:MFS transporter [Amycolatopsis magusensis]|uniref:MFS transporter n=1 Tax=Amycolatopsis magusensis TaxID=882444 RepID=UPI0024A84B23|nr:MFS transporter [Amycolatopsis magusensis]MDI5982735.1 MFS transporter [Amycolatopsis magusensis]